MNSFSLLRSFGFNTGCFLFSLLPLVLTLPCRGAQPPSLPGLEQFPRAPLGPLQKSKDDWLLSTRRQEARVSATPDGRALVLENGLLRRVIRLEPNAATIGLDDLRTGQRWLRSVRPEAMVTLDGVSYAVGGLTGQPDHAYLTPDWIASMTVISNAFQLIAIEKGAPTETLSWKKVRHYNPGYAWPPRGAAVLLRFVGSTEATQSIEVTVHYEIYDDLPALGKWLEIRNNSSRPLLLDQFVLEQLAVVEMESAVDERERHQWRTPPFQVLSDYSFKGMDPITATRVASWEPDPLYSTQVNYERRTPCLLVVKPPIGPGIRIPAGERFQSFRSHLVISDSENRERQGLALRRAWRTLAPWTTENPIMMHVRSAESKAFRTAVDQCADVGFEMIIYTFGSGLQMEKDEAEYRARVKADVDYAHSKGIEVGGYSLFSSRRIDDAQDVIHPKTGKPGGTIFGNAPCLGSEWGSNYLRKLKLFLQETGMNLLEHDGPYPGDVCASQKHPGHEGMLDSQWRQWELSRELYAWCRAQGIYVNQPDSYFLAGGNKTAMGYREDNWSLPRPQQLIHARQNIHDGTWEKTPSMGWMFVPLTEYHGGGKAATLEPLKDHLKDYELHLANTLGAGVQACWRGPRLYDSEETRQLVRKWVLWFKNHRDILESDLIHFARANGQDVDGYLHVNPTLKRRAMLVLFNPLNEPVTQTISIPLYYSGLQTSAVMLSDEGRRRRVKLDEKAEVQVSVDFQPHGVRWFVFEK